MQNLRTSSETFSAVLGLPAALPIFGVDMILPSLSATAVALGAPSAEIGLTMGVYLLSLGGAPLRFGPLSDRFGRKTTIIWDCLIVIAESIGCILVQSLPQLLAF